MSSLNSRLVVVRLFGNVNKSTLNIPLKPWEHKVDTFRLWLQEQIPIVEHLNPRAAAMAR